MIPILNQMSVIIDNIVVTFESDILYLVPINLYIKHNVSYNVQSLSFGSRILDNKMLSNLSNGFVKFHELQDLSI